MRKKYTLPGLLIMVAVLFMLSACGGSSVTAGQLLSNSANAMKQIKSLHLDMTATVNVGVSGLPSSGSSSSIPSNSNITVNASGDEVMPDQTSLKLSASGFGAGKFAFAEIVKGNQLYIQNAQGQWYVMDKSKLEGTTNSIGNLLSNASAPDFSKLLNMLEKDVTVVDHGDETLNGASLRHITVTLDKNGLAKLLENTDQLKGITQQNINELLNSVNNFNASLDFWFDEATSYIHRFELKLNTAVDASKLGSPTTGTTTGTPSGFSLKADITVDLSKFNDPSIKITAPANAIPTDNPGVIFGAA
ncbi:MAG: DUF6612 family protein [Ktedonobacteraceae bacterium]